MSEKKASLLNVTLGKADLHIHSNYSDGAPSPAQILEYIENYTDLDVIAIADHDTLEGAQEAQRIYQEGQYRFEYVLAEEVTTKEGHVLAAYIKELIPANLELRETLKLIRRQGGLAIASHPLQHSRLKHAHYATMDGVGATALVNNNSLFDGIETVNATPTLGDENIGAVILNKTVLFDAELGNSDAHILEAIGHGYTLFEGRSAQDLKKAILNHQTRAMYHKFTLLALFKYGYFYIPHGIRLLMHTLFHGSNHRRPDKIEDEIMGHHRN